MSMHPLINWIENGISRHAHWRSESGISAPKKVVLADDRITADSAYRLACEGVGLLWRGDFQNARQLLQALARRIDQKTRKTASSPTEAFHFHRQAQSQRARTLNMLLLPFDGAYNIPLRRAPDVRQACTEGYGSAIEAAEPFVASLRELQGLIGAHEWRKKGVAIPALGERIHPHYGVFSPARGEYVELVAKIPLPSLTLAFDIGTGTGVLAAVLAHRGVKRVIATDQDPRALACASENLTRLGYSAQVELVQTNLFPPGLAPLIMCNPPWLPARPNSPIEHAIYDPGSRMLLGFLHGLRTHLTSNGEGWLILSDFAEHLGLRSRTELLSAIDGAGLKVLGRTDVRPHHPRASDNTDPLYIARSAELTSLWRLAAR